MRSIGALILACLAISAPIPAYAQANKLVALLQQAGATQCQESSLVCLTLQVPRDHFANAPGETIEVTFAISLAIEASQGILFYAVGGPGYSGTATADGLLAAFNETLRGRLDIVFFELRGTGATNALDCPSAMAALLQADMSPAAPDAAIAAAQSFVAGCTSEASNADLIPFLDTEQAVRDLEAFRQAIGSPRVYLYGESYGTQFMQAYATDFPSAVRGLILDGTINLNLAYEDFHLSYIGAAERVLERVFDYCRNELPECARDFEGDPSEVYDALAARVASGPITLDYPMPDGTTAPRQLTSSLLAMSTFSSLYEPAWRANFLRALAAASRGNLLPILRNGYALYGLDSATLALADAPGYIASAYYPVTCGDYAEGTGEPAERAAAIMAEIPDLATIAPRFTELLYNERLVCAFWPHRGPETRPAPFAGGSYPTLILGADGDPITPITQGYAVLDNVENGSLVVMEGGPHVIFGRGLACPDAIVSTLLLTGEAPAQKVQVCTQELVEAYEPLTITDPAAATPREIVAGVEAELWQLPEFYNWYGPEQLRIGCEYGGTIVGTLGLETTTFELADCALWPNLTLTGAIRDADERTEFTLTVSGAHEGEIQSGFDWDTRAVSLTGTWDGQPVETPRPLP